MIGLFVVLFVLVLIIGLLITVLRTSCLNPSHGSNNRIFPASAKCPYRFCSPCRLCSSRLSNNGSVWIRLNTIDSITINALRWECQQLQPHAFVQDNHTIHHRWAMDAPNDSEAVRVFRSLEPLISKFAGEPVRLVTKELPVSYRIYTIGSSMGRHRDQVVFNPPQFEVVLTLTNTSDSTFQWVDSNDQTHTTSPNPGTLVVLRADGAEHWVTPLTRGHRVILKAAYVVHGARPVL